MAAKTKKKSAAKTTKASPKRKGGSDVKPSGRNDGSFFTWLHERYLSRFKGSWIFLGILILFGVLFPPAMSFGIMYLIYRCFPKEPRLFDRNIIIFALSMVLISLVSLSLIGLPFDEVVSMTTNSTMFTLLLGYPFVFAWLWFDWNYGLNADRKQ